MSNQFTVFDSAISALQATSFALSVTGQNIANVNTPGYSRQSAVIASRSPQTGSRLELGRGVDIKGVTQAYDKFMELRFRSATSQKAQYDTKTLNLQNISSSFNEVGNEGLSKFISQYFSAFQDLANDPTSISARQNVLSTAGTVIGRFHTLSEAIDTNRSLIDGDISNQVGKINELAQDIVALNEQIRTSASEAFTLKDQRYLKVRELSQYIDTNVVETTEGIFQVYIANGMQLINGPETAVLSTAVDVTNDNHYKVMFTVGNGTSIDISDRITDAALKGALDARDVNLPSYKTSLDELAYQLVTQVNAVHTTGYNLNSATNIRFFGNLASSTDAASLISLDAAVDGLPKAIAASGALADVPGGNSKAISISALSNTNVTFSSGDTTFASFYGDLLATIGNDTAVTENLFKFSELVYDQAEGDRERLSGVSVEEENVNLLKFQAAYSAASKLVGVANDMLKQLTELI